MELHKLTLEDRTWINEIALEEDMYSSDFCFGSLVLWNDYEELMCGKLEGRMIVCGKWNGMRFFFCPVGSGPIAPAINEIREICAKEDVPVHISCITEKNMGLIEQEMPGEFVFKEMGYYADYIYEIDKLADLSGRKLHSKKNHVNKFMSLYPDWRYEELRPEYFETCMSLLKIWQAGHDRPDEAEEIADEEESIRQAFSMYEEFGLEGGVLFADGKLCAFTLGEKCAKETFMVHFEKADVQIEGAFQMINMQFVRQIRDRHPEIRYINRTDDMGHESLRKAKQSYHPFCMERKYVAL